MNTNLSTTSDDFTIFGLSPKFKLSEAELTEQWRNLLAQTHPDKFVSQGFAAQRAAMQWSVRINEAYQRLKDPIKRAVYLCQINSHPIDIERNGAMPMEFLMQQMQWREAIEEARDITALDALQQEVLTEQQLRLTTLEKALDEQHDYVLAEEQIKILMFLRQFFRECATHRAKLTTAE